MLVWFYWFDCLYHIKCLTRKKFLNMYIINSSFWRIKFFGMTGSHIPAFDLYDKSVWHEENSCMELQAMHFTIFCVMLGIEIFHFVQNSCIYQMSFSLFLQLKINLYSRNLFETKPCFSFTVVRVVLLSFFC